MLPALNIMLSFVIRKSLVFWKWHYVLNALCYHVKTSGLELKLLIKYFVTLLSQYVQNAATARSSSETSRHIER